MSDPGDQLVVERRGNVCVLRLNRPDARNALSPGLLHALGTAIVAAESDDDVRAVVITGTGDRAFCAGMDLRSFAGGGERRQDPAVMATYMRLLDGGATVPVVGAANATAVGGGLELLLGCDVIVASSEARFGLPEVKRGLIAGGNGTAVGTRIPFAVAMELVLTGETITAERAYDVGLVNAVVAPDGVLDAAVALAERIATNGPLAVAASRELARLAVADPPRWSERRAELGAAVFASEDAAEGAAAFVEKRPPVWRGR